VNSKRKTRGKHLSFFFLLSITALSPTRLVNSQMICKDGAKRSRVSEQTKKQPKTAVFRFEIGDRFTFEITGEAKGVQSECNIEVKGYVLGACKAKGDITVGGDVEAKSINGDVVCNALECDNIKGNVILTKVN
jgi:hypothetical protein